MDIRIRKGILSLVLAMNGFMFGHLLEAQISTQVGIGALFINGDVDPVKDAFNSFHLGISKEVRNNLNLEVKFGLGKAIGLSGSYMETALIGGGLTEDVYSIYGERPWYPNYISDYKYIDIGANYILNTGIPRLRFIGGAGIGISFSKVSVNLLDRNSFIYNKEFPISTPIDQVKELLDFSYDASYETAFEEGGGTTPHLALQLGMQIRITRGIFFSADIRYHLTANDYLDPITNISATQNSGNNDFVNIVTIGFVGYLLPDEKETKGPVK